MPDITSHADRQEVRISEGVLAVTRKSIFTGRVNTMHLPITSEQEALWKSGVTYIQTALPNLNADQREFLMTGAGPGEWDEIFPDEDDDV
jgi:hypothetical protein